MIEPAAAGRRRGRQCRGVTPAVAVAPQYDTTHVYVAPTDFDRFAASFLATFGGASTKQVEVDVMPTPSNTLSQLLQTPVGTVSLFGSPPGLMATPSETGSPDAEHDIDRRDCKQHPQGESLGSE